MIERTTRPVADSSASGWTPSTGSALYATVDETTPSDSDYVAATRGPNSVVFALGPLTKANDGSLVIRYRVRSPDSGVDMRATLLQGSTSIATRLHRDIVKSGFQTLEMRLTAAEIAAITDFSALSIKIEADYGAEGLVIDGIYPALALNFAVNESLDPRITFTRATAATYFDSRGRMQIAALGAPRFDHDPVTGESLGLLVEEARTNLLIYSSSFESSWVKGTSASWTAENLAPDGSLTALGVTGMYSNTISSSAAALYRTGITVTGGTTYTASVYVKAVPGNTGTVILRLSETGGNNTVGQSTQIFEDRWTRLALTITTASGATAIAFVIGTDSSINLASCYIWGAQLEAGSFPTSYIPSTVSFTSRSSTATYIGSNGLIQTAAADVARYQYNPNDLTVAPKLLLESAATNLLLYSGQFDNAAWARTRSTVTTNSITAPDGTVSADSLVSDGTGSAYLYQGETLTQAQPYVVSVFVKAGTYARKINITDYTDFGVVYFDLTTLALTVTGTATDAKATALANGWYRISAVFTPTIATGNHNIGIGFADAPVASEFIYLWGAQLETGNYATSYIPTTTAAVTRNADVSSSSATTRNADLTNMDPAIFFNRSDGVFYAEYDLGGVTKIIAGSADDRRHLYYLSNTTSTSNGLVSAYVDDESSAISAQAFDGNDGTTFMSKSAGLISQSATNKFALGYAYDGTSWVHTACSNGVLAAEATNTPFTLLEPMTFMIGTNPTTGLRSLNGHIKRLAYYNRRLTNAQLQALTAG